MDHTRCCSDRASVDVYKRQVPLSAIAQVVLLPPYTSSVYVGGQDALMPNWALIRPEVAKYFPVAS